MSIVYNHISHGRIQVEASKQGSHYYYYTLFIDRLSETTEFDERQEPML